MFILYPIIQIHYTNCLLTKQSRNLSTKIKLIKTLMCWRSQIFLPLCIIFHKTRYNYQQMTFSRKLFEVALLNRVYYSLLPKMIFINVIVAVREYHLTDVGKLPTRQSFLKILSLWKYQYYVSVHVTLRHKFTGQFQPKLT